MGPGALPGAPHATSRPPWALLFLSRAAPDWMRAGGRVQLPWTPRALAPRGLAGTAVPTRNAVQGVLGRTPRAGAVGEVPHTDAAQHCPGCRPGRRGLGSPPVTALQLTAFHLVKNTYLPLKFSEARLDKE